MNYYEHHLGDYDGATAHLSWLEDCAYRRMLCLYYRTESPLPTDPKQVCRLVRATSKPERDAVQQVLGEFFELAEDGWHNTRCDEDIAAYRDLEPEREAKRENAKERQRRARQRRAELFEALRGHNIVPPYDTTTKALEALLSRVTNAQQVTEPVTPVTRDNTATHTHLPPPTSQPPVPNPIVLSPTEPPELVDQPQDPDAWRLDAIGDIAAAMKRAGVSRFQAGDPRAVDLYRQGAAASEFEALGREAIDRGVDDPWSWLLTVLPKRRAKAAGTSLAPKPPDPMAWRKTSEGLFAMAAELGVKAKPDELYHDLERRVVTAFQRARSAQASAA